MKWITDYFSELLYLTNEMSPYLLLGFLIAGVLHVVIRKDLIRKYVGKNNIKSVIYAAFLGIPLPLCSCGVIPTGISFKKEGASNGATVSFLISTPQTGVDSIMITYSMLGLPFAIIRPIVALVSGVFGGFITSKLPQTETHNQEANTDETCTDGCSTEERPATNGKSKIYNILYYGFVEFMEDIAKWLVIGLLLAAFLSVIIPDNFFSAHIDNPIVGMLLILAASIPLYICATGSVPLAAVLLMKGISPGAALVFLMAGPATNIATLTVLNKSLGRKATLSYLFSIIISALGFGLLVDYTLPREWFEIIHESGHIHNEILPAWLQWGSTIILTLLLLNALFKKYTIMWFSRKKTIDSNLTLKVDGMTCNHCKATIEKHVGAIKGVQSVEVILSSKEVHISGTNIPLKKVQDTITELGYTVVL
ncbi:MAG: SO_0444 family Cu/Zn efflux transporter [Bacteroidales bacterium]